jgi:hypothetical protein
MNKNKLLKVNFLSLENASSTRANLLIVAMSWNKLNILAVIFSRNLKAFLRPLISIVKLSILF